MNLILSPHFDDAVLSLGGLLAKEGRDSVVATFFAGTPPEPLARSWDLSSGFADSTEAMRERAEEDTRALNFLGVPDDRIRAYAHLDHQYRHQKGGPTAPEPELEEAIRREMEALVREFGGAPLKVYAPGLEAGKAHLDHVLLKRAALAAWRALPAGSAEFLFYQDIPYAISAMDAAYPRGIRHFFKRMRDYSLLERSAANGSLALEPVVIPLEKADMKKKGLAAACYASQLNGLGKNLLRRIRRFSAAQARARSLPSPYCEVAYALH